MSKSTDTSQDILLLEQAAHAATKLNVERWQFAVELGAFAPFGITVTDLRLLVKLGIAKHARETTKESAKERTFIAINSLSFPPGTCFVLHESQEVGRNRNNGKPHAAMHQLLADRNVPRWDSATRTLTVAGQIVKRFKVPADSQETVLAAFEEEGWPPSIDDPLKPVDGQVHKQRLHNTINALNRGQLVKSIQFHGNGKGTAVSWEFCAPREIREDSAHAGDQKRVGNRWRG